MRRASRGGVRGRSNGRPLFLLESSAQRDAEQNNAAKDPDMEVVVRPSAPHALTLVFLHGFGMTSQEMAEEFAGVFSAHPAVRFVFPQAPTLAVTAYGGEESPSWYDYLTDREGDDEDVAEMCSVKAEKARIQRLLWREVRRGVPLVVGGLSQGGCLALDIATTSAPRLKAVITCAAHRLFHSRMKPLAAPWYALSAERDETFPASWAAPRPDEARLHEVALEACHHLLGGEGPRFVSKVLGELSKTCAARSRGGGRAHGRASS